jgi:hypothetical protein
VAVDGDQPAFALQLAETLDGGGGSLVQRDLFVTHSRRDVIRRRGDDKEFAVAGARHRAKVVGISPGAY